MNIEAFFKVSYGLYIIGAQHEGKKSGYIANTAFQVTAEPPRFAISCSKNNFSVNIIRNSGAFSISILDKDASADVIGRFGYNSSSAINKFETVEHITAETGAPIVTDECIAWFECIVEEEISLDTHVIFIGKLVSNHLIDGNKEPLTYAHYRDVKKGIAPKNAPTYIDKDKVSEVGQEEKSMGDSYSCDLCGYEYDPVEGDPDNGIPPGTPFEDLPEDWVCPICGAEKEDFSEQ